ncbi:MAG: D-glycero-beta-D-manno-heptose-7-phosphate kinase [Succiniclasticum sp.]|uniref:D-glycero-beta-D-manno-heptose-7-phosphate kinase n=1 Tax=Succiniclasticum sp. TaxID=2775030 RepID=UPI002A91BDC6|nr:D-glycero-beta-D-manno-heptose-7-phosphate kinase [Succiniclasticum sp.]MDY6291078.1 D-glycero-beta-D-manno-heptose-7-phosphate kinase [Succiniclasticum sp.]
MNTTNRICSFFLSEKIQNLHIAVIGDVMVDRYFYGVVKRISPEAPVPVNHVKKIQSVLGGAANVAANLATLGCHVYVGGVTGDDANRKILEELLTKEQIDYSGLVKSRRRSTITKMRILGDRQQMLRMDFEEVGDLYPEETDELKQWLLHLIKRGLDGIAISDYAKGVCSDSFCQWVIRMAAAHSIPVLIDPKGPHWEKYEGCTFITPNLKEMCEAAGQTVPNEDAPVLQLAQAAKERYNIKNVVVTRSEKGMTLVGDKRLVIHSPATALEVFDVSGAGDTAAAALLVASVGGLSLSEAVYMANRAAGIVVGKVGTYPVHRDELLQDILNEERKLRRGFRPLSWKEVADLAQAWHKRQETIVFTNGCFDILHVGHVSYLEKAARLGKHLIVGLNSDDSVRRLKGETRPLVCELDRARILASLSCVDAVVIFHEDTPEKLIKMIQPDIMVKGGDYQPEQVAGREFAGKVEIIEFEEGYSTTGLVEQIASLVKAGKI